MTTTITDWTDLDNVRNNLSDDYVLANDLDSNTSGYSGIGDDFDMIGSAGDPFRGTFDGQGHQIADVVIDKPSFGLVGLFSQLRGSTVGQLFIDGTVTGNNDVGILVGEIEGTSTVVRNCVTTGSATADLDNCGGMVGRFEDEPTVEQCYSAATVDGGSSGDRIGGFLGLDVSDASGTIERCYSYGSVSGDSLVGGFSGFTQGGTVIDSYWDTQASGQSSTGGGATGLTTSEMQSLSAESKMPEFNYAAVWSPVDGSDNAGSDGYPVLRRVDLAEQASLQGISISDYLPGLTALSATLQSGDVPPTDLSWSRRDPVSARVYRSDVSSPTFPGDFALVTTVDSTSASDATIVNDGTYTYRVVPTVDGEDLGPPSNADDVTTVVPLEALSATSADLNGPGVELSWTLNYSTLDDIEVYRTEGTGGTFPDDFSNTDTVGGAATDTEDTAVDADEDYTYRVTGAIDNVGESDPTAADTASLGSIGPFIVTITGTNSPVDSGEELSVDYELENQGEFTGDASIDLEVTPQ